MSYGFKKCKLALETAFISVFTFLYTAQNVLAAPKNFKDLVNNILLPIVDQATKILIAIAVLIFFWNIAINVWGERTEEKNTKLRNSIIWGLLIIFIMVSIWGILALLRVTLMRGI